MNSTREYDFEDNDLSRFLVYDYNWSQQCRNKNQKNITEEDFWKCEEPRIFRVNASKYADHRKFKKWIYDQVFHLFDLSDSSDIYTYFLD